MNLSTRCPHCSFDQTLKFAFWSGVRYKIDCERCGTEIIGFLVQQTINWPRLQEKAYSPQVFPIETAPPNRASFSDRAIRLVNAAIVWLRAPLSQPPSRQFVR
jgi:hypothetical protein